MNKTRIVVMVGLVALATTSVPLPAAACPKEHCPPEPPRSWSCPVPYNPDNALTNVCVTNDFSGGLEPEGDLICPIGTLCVPNFTFDQPQPVYVEVNYIVIVGEGMYDCQYGAFAVLNCSG